MVNTFGIIFIFGLYIFIIFIYGINHDNKLINLLDFFQLKDLVEFILIAIFVIFGVGIYYHANLYPDHNSMWYGKLSRWRIWTIIFHPYWELYGELDLDTLDGTEILYKLQFQSFFLDMMTF